MALEIFFVRKELNWLENYLNKNWQGLKQNIKDIRYPGTFFILLKIVCRQHFSTYKDWINERVNEDLVPLEPCIYDTFWHPIIVPIGLYSKKNQAFF